MNKIIDGKKYDTNTAKLLETMPNGFAVNDFNYVRETLYQKKTGEFFLHGEGGAASKYSESCGLNTRCGGERIIPLTDEQARKWCEEYCTVEKYEEIFGEVSE